MVEFIVQSLVNMGAEFFQDILNLILPLFGFDFALFNQAFPYAATAYKIFQSSAVGIALLIATWHLVPMLAGQRSQDNSSPIRIAGGLMLAIAAIFYGNYFLEVLMDIAKAPFDALLYSDATGNYAWGTSFTNTDGFTIGDTLRFALGNTPTGAAVSAVTYLVLLIMIGIAFIKLLLEALERYVVLFVLLYTSPLLSSTLASDTTRRVFSSFVSMFIGQCCLMVLNIWSIKMVLSMFDNIINSSTPFLNLLLGYAFIRIASGLDSYMNRLGLSAAVTGVGLGSELFATGMAMMGQGRSLMGGKTSAAAPGGASNGNPLLKAADNFAQGVTKHNPVAAPFVAAENAIRAGTKTAVQGVRAGWDSFKNAPGSTYDKLFKQPDMFTPAAEDAMKKNAAQNFHEAALKTQGQNNAARSVMQAVGRDGQAMETLRSLRHNNPLWPDQTKDVASNAWMAEAAMDHAAGKNNDWLYSNETADNAAAFPNVTDANSIGAVMQGLGIEAASEDASEAVNVAYGTIPADNARFSMDQDGIQGQYTKDGFDHSWSIKSAEQFSQLPHQEQQKYAEFKTANGGKYYMAHDKVRTTPAYQKQAEATNASIAAFTANPLGAGLSAEAKRTMQRDPSQIRSVYENMGASGQRIDTSTPEGRQAIRNLVDMTPVSGGKAMGAKNTVMNHLASGGGEINGHADSNGYHLEWKDASGVHEFTSYTPAATESIDTAELTSSGYQSVDYGGDKYGYVGYTAPLAGSDLVRSSIDDYVTSGTPIPAEQCVEIGRNNELLMDLFDKMDQSDKSFTYTKGEETEENRMIADIVNNLNHDAISRPERHAMASAISSGTAEKVGFDNYGIYAFRNEGENGHSITVLSPHAVEGNSSPASPKRGYERKTQDYLDNRGYQFSNVGSKRIYALSEKDIVTDKKGKKR